MSSAGRYDTSLGEYNDGRVHGLHSTSAKKALHVLRRGQPFAWARKDKR